MGNQREVNIEPVKGASNEYVIKDKDKIVAGRFTIDELDKENKRSTIRFKFYRENSYELLKASIKSFVDIIIISSTSCSYLIPTASSILVASLKSAVSGYLLIP